MATTIKTIQEICGKIANNKGVKSWLLVVEMCGVKKIPSPVDFVEDTEDTYHSINDHIELKDEYVPVLWYGRKKDADMSFEDDGEQDEEIVKIDGTLYIPRIDGFKTFVTNQARGTEFLILFWDENHTTPRILGEINNGVTIKVKEQHNPKNGYILTISGEVVQKPFWFRGNFVKDDGAGGTEVVYDMSA